MQTLMSGASCLHTLLLTACSLEHIFRRGSKLGPCWLWCFPWHWRENIILFGDHMQFFPSHSSVKLELLLYSCEDVSDSCDSIDLSLPCSSVTGISQASILAWVAISFSRGSFPTQGLHLSLLLGGWILYHWATWEAHKIRGDSPNWDTVCVLKWKMLTSAPGPFL